MFHFGNVQPCDNYIRHHYTIIVFQFNFFYLDFTVDICPKIRLLSLYTHGRTGNILCPTFWQDFHILFVLAITTAIGTTSQSRSIRFKEFFKALEPYIYLDWGCWTVTTLTTGCPKQCQFPLQHMWGSATVQDCANAKLPLLPCKMHAQIKTFIIFPIYLRIKAFRHIQERLRESITSTPPMPAV